MAHSLCGLLDADTRQLEKPAWGALAREVAMSQVETELPSSARRARGGGGAARRAERTAPQHEFARYIERKIPNFEILNAEALEIIEWNADTVLEEIGVKFVDNPGALALWRDAGADVKGEKVHIPRGLARKCFGPRRGRRTS